MDSPFINQISDCKKRMRKLRKKIYKHNINQNDKKSSSKHQDISSILINIFQKRNLPPTIISSLKNKRNIDIFSLKSLAIGNQSSLKWDATTLQKKTSDQEQQVQKLYKQHCQRMQELKKCQTPRFSRRILTSNYISSTQGDYSSQQNQQYLSEQSQCSQFNENVSQNYHHAQNFQNSIEENIFSEVLLDRKKEHQQIQEHHPFSCFEMNESSMLSGENIFNF